MALSLWYAVDPYYDLNLSNFPLSLSLHQYDDKNTYDMYTSLHTELWNDECFRVDVLDMYDFHPSAILCSWHLLTMLQMFAGHGCFGAFGASCPGAMVRSWGKCWTAPIFDSDGRSEMLRTSPGRHSLSWNAMPRRAKALTQHLEAMSSYKRIFGKLPRVWKTQVWPGQRLKIYLWQKVMAMQAATRAVELMLLGPPKFQVMFDEKWHKTSFETFHQVPFLPFLPVPLTPRAMCPWSRSV